jgi:ribonuclease HII
MASPGQPIYCEFVESMAVLLGIDEAGYGPLLGPLVVSGVAIGLPDELLRADLWQVLHKAVSKEKRHLSGRLLVTDSKKAYTPKSGINALRRTVLASLVTTTDAQSIPDSPRGLLQAVCPTCSDRLADYPWYGDLDQFSLGGNAPDIQLAATILRKALAENHSCLKSIRSRCLDVGYFNRMVSIVKNKASVLFTEVCTLIQQALNELPAGQVLHVVVDRQGGRSCYRPALQRMFSDMELAIVREDENLSSYELVGGGKTMRIHFPVGAEMRCLPVALASMVSKYVREVLNESMNQYFCRQCQQLRPTAGYWQDGQRFIRDLETHRPDFPWNRELLIRNR